MKTERNRKAASTLLALLALLLVEPQSARADSRTIEVSIVGGAVEGESTLRVVAGDTVGIVIHSDTSLQLHLHGYDIKTSVEANIPARMTIHARIEGRFSIEAHGPAHGAGSHRTLLYLEVHPR